MPKSTARGVEGTIQGGDKMDEKRLGRQTPTVSVILPYTETLGAEVVEAYDRSTRKSIEWQQRLAYDIMAVNEEGLFVHMKFGYSVPRRNGKSEILVMRSTWGVSHERRVLYTAHRTTTSHSAWERCVAQLSGEGYVEGQDFKTIKQFGLEQIIWLTGRGIINFRTRSSKGGLGEGYDDLIIDEAQEYTADQESALKYVVTDSPNPQTIMCGTPPTAVSSGTVFLKYRRLTLSGRNADAGWAEWSVPQLTDAHDPELWYETNPSLGTILSERTIRSELGDDQVDDNIQRLGLWIEYSQKSAISRQEWLDLQLDAKPTVRKQLYFGVKFGKDTGTVSLSVAAKTADGRIFVEAIDCRSVKDGNAWIIAYLRNPHLRGVAIDGANGQVKLAEDIKDAGVKKKPVLPKVSEIIAANTLFEQNIFSGIIAHGDQASVLQIVANSEHRAIGSGGGFGYVSMLQGADVTLIESLSLAHWLCAETKERKKQIISY